MRKLVASAFVSLDGVMQAPGGPEEDPTGGFAYGGWIFNYGVEGMDISASGFDGKDRDVVLGRKTYEIFEAYWPYQPADDPIAKTLNAARKYVASRTLKTLQWENSVLLGEDIVQAIAALKAQPGHDLQIIGSSNLIQSLQAASLIDEYNVWTYPLVLGRGKRLFEATAKPGALRLVSTKASTTGVVMSTYVPAGNIRPGSFAQAEPSRKELDRRAKMARQEGKMSSEQQAPETKGITVKLLGTVDLGPEIEGMAGRQFRMRMVTFEPGAVFGPVHDHKDRPGIVYILQGTITDHRNGVATDYGPGVGWPEDRNTMHWLENRGTIPAVEISVDIVRIK